MIAYNRGDGVRFSGSGATGNAVRGNTIRSNRGDGVSFYASASNNAVGGVIGGWSVGNTIAYNAGYGVYMASGTGNTIRANAIYLNALGGIRLDPGANNNLLPPGITLRNGPAPTTYGGTLRGPAGTYTIDFYVNSAGTSQGAYFLGSLRVTVGSTGSASFVFSSSVPGLSDWVTATATDSAGNTSEFSLPAHYNP
jgi:titin